MPGAKCHFCGEEFKPTKKWQRFCSDKCRNNFHNDNKLRASGDDSVPVIKCPHCKTDEYRMFEVIEKDRYLCNVCAKEFGV